MEFHKYTTEKITFFRKYGITNSALIPKCTTEASKVAQQRAKRLFERTSALRYEPEKQPQAAR